MTMDERQSSQPGATVSEAAPKAPASPVLNRRTVLAAATAAGIGVAASRLAALANEPSFTTVPVTGSLANKGGLDWVSPLGAEPARYDAYAAAIRQEFIHVPERDYRAGRAKVLGQFAARPVIFPDTAFAARYDRQARENLARELASLR